MKILFHFLILTTVAAWGSFSSATSYEADTKTVHIKASGPLENQTVSSEYDFNVQVYRVHEEQRLVPQTYQHWVCDETPGNGKGDWKGFFNAKKADKPSRLSQAIRGIGSGRAPKMVKYFDHKPRSWNAFARLIKSADSEVQGVYYDVVIQFGADNRRNLGYESSSSDCHYETVTEYVWVTKKVRTPSHNEQASVTVNFHDSKLLKSEKDSVQVTFDGFKLRYQKPSDNHNAYRIETREYGDSLVLDLYATERLRITPTNSIEVTPVIRNGEVYLKIRDNLYTSAEAHKLGSTRIHYKAMSRKWMIQSPDTKAGVANLSAKSSTSEIATGFRPKKGHYLRVEFSVERFNSDYFSNKKSESKTTEKMLVN